MKYISNPVQAFIRNLVRWGLFIPLWILIVWPMYRGMNPDLTTALNNPPRPDRSPSVFL